MSRISSIHWHNHLWIPGFWEFSFDTFILIWCIVQEFTHSFLMRSLEVFEQWFGIRTLIKEIKKCNRYSLDRRTGKNQLFFLYPSIPLIYLSETQISSLISLILLSLLNVSKFCNVAYFGFSDLCCSMSLFSSLFLNVGVHPMFSSWLLSFFCCVSTPWYISFPSLAP